MRIGSFVLGLAALALTATTASAAPYEAGTVLVRLRAVEVLPDFGSKVNLGQAYHVTGTDTVIPELDITYFLDPHWSLELIAGTTKHSLYLNNSVYIGSAWILPPTLTVQYHFDLGPVQPYVGAGINYSLFYDKRGAAGLGKLKMTDQWGGALQAGFDVPLSEDGKYFLNMDVKKIFVSTHASFTGSAAAADVDVNPWLIGAGIGIRF
ncbi:OmpW/AlkL family protein [Rhizomicrobium electricum]|uniref:OmpW family protein n=1 Tax=Rhizomicrobium electricum TaxID=480070 RepID=A0ABN1F9E2_9PROT|nr:OmpW family protein [Rhizomicrobium electricum]NIJ46806.1 outer membrane protein [Rhizomicrobium electricum]